MNNIFKKVEELNIGDLELFPVWRYINHDESGETMVQPIKKIPVKNLKGCFVGTQIRLANHQKRWALIGNVDTSNPRLTQHFLTISVFDKKCWFTMARYHDFNAKERGPQALAVFLDLQIDQIFPISYDIREFSDGDPSVLVGKIEKEPIERLTRAQIIALAVSKV